MKTWIALALPCLALSACTEEPNRKTAEENSVVLANETKPETVEGKRQNNLKGPKKRNKSKRADAKAEIDAAATPPAQ